MEAAQETQDLMQKAIQLETESQFDACDALFQEITENEADNAEAFMRYGQFLCRTNQFEKAKDMLNKGLELQPASPFTWFYLAVVYGQLERPDNVEICYKNALLLEPDNERYLKRFVDFLFSEGRMDEALPYINKVMEGAEENDATSSYMLALSSWSAGDLLSASQYLEKAALGEESNVNAIIACMESLFYLDKFEELERFTSIVLQKEGVDPTFRPLIKMMKYLAIFSLNPSMNLRDRIEALNIPQYNPSENASLNQFNFNMWAYRHAIRHFYAERMNGNLNYAEGFLKDPNTAIYFVGESHAFEPLHLKLEVAGETRRAAAKLVMGVKAFHLASKGRNQHKTVFEERCKQLPQSCMVGICVGEIDCRATEGFAPYFIKNPDVDQEVYMRTILTDFVSYVEKTLSPQKPQKIYLMGIPAPSLSDKEEVNENEQMRIKVIALYNKVLQEICIDKDKIDLLDFYDITANEEGHSNGKWHTDDHVHLKPSAYIEAFNRLS